MKGLNDPDTKDSQYPHTSFFEGDLHAGKEMNIEFTILHSSEEQKRSTVNDEALENSRKVDGQVLMCGVNHELADAI